jgi:cytochrome b561
MGKAAALSHAAFYALLVAAPILGVLAYYLGKPFGDLHELCKPALIILIGAHAAAALFHQFWLKDGTLRRMLVPGR